jgi:hypothetical protein
MKAALSSQIADNTKTQIENQPRNSGARCDGEIKDGAVKRCYDP